MRAQLLISSFKCMENKDKTKNNLLKRSAQMKIKNLIDHLRTKLNIRMMNAKLK